MAIVLQKGYTNKQYADMAVLANASGKILTILESGDVDMAARTISLVEAKSAKMADVNSWTKSKIIGGFVSSATGSSVTFDSDEETQSTMQTMYAASKSPNFEAHPVYQGLIPVRGFAEGATEKTIYSLTAAQIQTFMDDLALHIGSCKQAGWEKQALVGQASTIEELNSIEL